MFVGFCLYVCFMCACESLRVALYACYVYPFLVVRVCFLLAPLSCPSVFVQLIN